MSGEEAAGVDEARLKAEKGPKPEMLSDDVVSGYWCIQILISLVEKFQVLLNSTNCPVSSVYLKIWPLNTFNQLLHVAILDRPEGILGSFYVLNKSIISMYYIEKSNVLRVPK